MTAKKVFIGLAVVGGGLYYYDQNVAPIFPKDKKVAVPSEAVNKDLRKLDRQTHELGSQVKKTAGDQADAFRSKTDSAVSAVKEKTDSAVNAVKESDMYNRWSGKLDDYLKDVRLAAEEIEQKPLPSRLAAKYIELVNKIGQTETEKLDELASSTSSRQQQIKSEMNRSQQSWSSWWSGKKNEADSKVDELQSRAEQEKQGWLNWGSSKKDEADAKMRQAKDDAEKKKDLWMSWGSSKKEEADRKLSNAKADAEKEKDLWVSWGSSKKDEADRKLKQAQNDAEKSKDLWVSWGNSKADEVNSKAQEAKDSAQSQYEKQKKNLSESFEAGKNRAVSEYNRAKANLDDLTKQASDKAGTLFGQAKVDEQNHLEKAKQDLQSAATNLRKYGSDLVDLVTGDRK